VEEGLYTDRGRNFVGNHVNHALTNLTTVQLLKRLLCNVESTTGGVDGSNLNRHPRRRVRDVPAPAAIRRVPNDVESAADEREGGNVAELWEFRGKTVCLIGAWNIVEEPKKLLYVPSEVTRKRMGVEGDA